MPYQWHIKWQKENILGHWNNFSQFKKSIWIFFSRALCFSHNVPYHVDHNTVILIKPKTTLKLWNRSFPSQKEKEKEIANHYLYLLISLNTKFISFYPLQNLQTSTMTSISKTLKLDTTLDTMKISSFLNKCSGNMCSLCARQLLHLSVLCADRTTSAKSNQVSSSFFQKFSIK